MIGRPGARQRPACATSRWSRHGFACSEGVDAAPVESLRPVGREGYLRQALILVLEKTERELMLAKLTSDNQLTLPEAVTGRLQGTEYLEVALEADRIVLTPVQVVRAAAIRAKLAEMGITEKDVADAVEWARSSAVQEEG